MKENNEICHNIENFELFDRFGCSECGIIIEGYVGVGIDDDEEITELFKPSYCPNCGRKIVEED